MSDTPPGEPYKGPPGIARDSTWLTNEDIPHDRDTVAVIEAVLIRKNLKFQGGRDKPVGLSIKFVGKQRELLLNATNRKVLAALYGAHTGDWFGRSVALFVEQDVRRPDGTRGPAVRIQPKRFETPVGKTVGKPAAPAAPAFDRAAAIASLSEESIQGDVGRAMAALSIPQDAVLDTLTNAQLASLSKSIWPA